MEKYDVDKHIEDTKADLINKFLREDWHGCADCAMDLRDLYAFKAGKEGKEHP